MNPFLKMILGSLKGLAITAIIPIVSEIDPAAGKELADGAAAFSDSTLSLEEAEILACDTCDVVAEKLPRFAPALALVKKNITEDVPLIATKIIPDFEATYKAFEIAAKA